MEELAQVKRDTEITRIALDAQDAHIVESTSHRLRLNGKGGGECSLPASQNKTHLDVIRQRRKIHGLNILVVDQQDALVHSRCSLSSNELHCASSTPSLIAERRQASGEPSLSPLVASHKIRVARSAWIGPAQMTGDYVVCPTAETRCCTFVNN